MLRKVNGRVNLVLSEIGFTYCNCLLIDDDVKAVVDTGAGPEAIKEIRPQSVDLVLNSHHHFDHIRGNHLFSNARVLIHSQDYPPLTSFEAFEHYNSVDRWNELMHGFDQKDGIQALGIPEEQIEQGWKVDETLEDNQVIDFGHTSVQIIHTPGHSAGHCAFWFPEEEFLFTSDICLTKVGPWYGEMYASPDEMIASINRLIDLKPTWMTSSHIKEIYQDGPSRLNEFKDRIYQREERILSAVKKEAASVEEMSKSHLIYKYHPTPFVLFWERLMIMKHLDRLIRFGLVEETEPGLFKAV